MMRQPPRRAGYFIRQRLHIVAAGGGFERDAYYRDDMLVELTRQELREHEAEYGPGRVRYRRTHWTAAHDWVRRDRPHGTGLWIDDGRIRYAPADPGC